MARLTIILDIDLRPMQRKIRKMREGIRKPSAKSNPIRRMMVRWSDLYAEFIRRRYMAEGFGSWPPLAPITIRRKGHARILRDTDTMLENLNTRVTKIIHEPFGLRVVFGSSKKHPKSKLTIRQLLAVHNFGLGTVPERRIFVLPPASLRRRMLAAASQASQEIQNT